MVSVLVRRGLREHHLRFCQHRNRRSCRRYCRRILRRRVQPIARYQKRGEDVLVVVTFFALRESLGLINCFNSLLLANPC